MQDREAAAHSAEERIFAYGDSPQKRLQMNILYLHQYFSTPAGSTGLRSYEFARALAARGHAVTVFCVRDDGSVTGLESQPYFRRRRTGIVDGLGVIELQLKYSNLQSFAQRVSVFLRFAFGAIREACRRNYDIVFATSTPLTVAIPGIVAHVIARKRFVFEVRDLWPELPRAMGVIRNPVILGLMALLEKAAYHSAIRLIGLSPGIVQGIIRHNISPDHVKMIPNACDTTIFNPSRKGALAIPGVRDDDFTAVFSGTIGIANGAEAILDVASELKKRKRDRIKLLLIGRGNRKDMLKERAAREKLDNCIFLDPIPKHEIARLIASSGVGLMVLANVPAFYYGTSPNKFFDYIASGIPVINNYPGWLAEMINECDCGFAVPPEDPVAFADALCGLADDENLRRRMGNNALKLSAKFQRQELARQFCSVIEEAARAVS
jgi:glycosyltransferase involved in cell wall biosynthesis